jgi:PGF-CTERM protein
LVTDATAADTVNVRPRIEAVIDVEQQPVVGGAPAVFNASDSVGQGLDYTWELETVDETVSSSVIEQPYRQPGEYGVTLIVEDEFGRTNEATTTVTVESESTDDSAPGFGSVIALLALLAVAFLARRRPG